ncbi:ABC-type transporter, integral membrane subunit [Crinalium epipsammum PCC 9333]|uniref:ABC-type transporter, integral membrane subunit n=1 Tax=Crinalium epipsammum PCC 9333 TaxID=1173022 RepID=K9W568_9CYAN|nr:CbiQ family ECF transporter T component [Crinalium epipsammum]AFZ14580.1 ABC-type transporter, integral membrane subunit [Crinalium epipsammum PCC 9333]
MDLLRSLPLGLYLEKPITWLHHLDPRVKLAWLMSFLFAPILANPYFRVALVVLLILMTLTAAIPWRVWKQQMGWLLMLAALVLVLTAIAPDGLNVGSQPRLPATNLELPQPTSYQYILLKLELGSMKLLITRKSLDLAINVSTLLFTLIYSTNLFLLTTAPEEITDGIESFMRPLRRFNVPVTEIILTLTLSLRFIPLVLEEVQNLSRSIWTRAIDWKKLGIRRSSQVWLMVAERLLENLLLRAEQIASAMNVRGFTTPNTHRVQWHELRLRAGDFVALGVLVLLWGARVFFGTEA